MVIMDYFSILNKSVLNVLDDTVMIETTEFDDKVPQIRLEETPVSVAEVRERLNNVVVVGHNLTQYINKFYSIYLDSSEIVAIDYLINATKENIDLTGFGEFI